tara:strand:- start:294 stop:1331 length:1038 start_codon:yes stop_codon:yes gene_type:complete
MQEFMSLVRGNKQAEKGFQASVMGQLFARSLSKHDALLKETGDLAFKAFDPVRFRELLSDPRVRIIIQEAFPDNASLLSGLDDLAKVAFETSNFTKGSGAQGLLKPAESVNLSGWAFLGRVSALGAANQTKLVNALWAGGAGSTLGKNLARKITGAKLKDIVIDAAIDPEKGVALSLQTAEQASGFWRTAAQAAIDVINVPGAAIKRPAAAIPIIKRGEEELDEAAPEPPASVPLAQPLSTGQQPAVPPYQGGKQRMRETIRGINPASTLFDASPFSGVQTPPPTPPPGQASQQTLAGLAQMGMPLFPIGAAHGGYITGGAGSGAGRMEDCGIMSVRRKPRQLVG